MVVKEKAGSERQRQGFGSTFTNSRTVFIGNPLSWVEIFYLGEWEGAQNQGQDGENKGTIPDFCPSQIQNLSYLCFIIPEVK